jgi:hypothetical protein
MASQDDLLNRLIAIVRGFDDASWEALASKGLLRRARKEMEKGLAIEVVGESPSGLELKVPPFLVTMPSSGPAKAICTCPAPGICQHILATGLYLQARSSGASEQKVVANEDAVREEIAAFTPERIRDWAGPVEYRSGIALREKNCLPSVIEYGETVLVRLMPSTIEARFVPGGGLDGMILPSLNAKRVAVAVLLAVRASLGFEAPEAAAQRSFFELSGTPRTAKEILTSGQSVIEEAVSVGLSHLSPTVADRLVTLAVSAQGANLPRVSLALRNISDEVRSILLREARADESRLFTSAARVYALMEAIRLGGDTPDQTLIGTSRLQYVEVPEVELFGVGAYPWKTGSGYTGLTVLFWSNTSQEFLSWSEARPTSQKFEPRQRFYGEGPWDGAQSPRQVGSSHLKLRNARRTASGRISGSTKTSALVLTPTPPSSLQFDGKLFNSWVALHQYARNKQPLGLRDPAPLDMVVVLEPSYFDTRIFDSVTQTFTWDVYDEAGRMLKLSLPFREWNKDAIRILEGLTPPQEVRWKVISRVALRDDGIAVEPISLLRPDEAQASVFHLSFDALPKGPAMAELADVGEVDDDDTQSEDESFELEEGRVSLKYMGSFVSEFNRHLHAVAEAGTRRGLEDHHEWFERTRKDAHDSGLTSLAAVMEALLKSPPTTGRILLKARYLTYVYAQASGHFS